MHKHEESDVNLKLFNYRFVVVHRVNTSSTQLDQKTIQSRYVSILLVN